MQRMMERYARQIEKGRVERVEKDRIRESLERLRGRHREAKKKKEGARKEENLFKGSLECQPIIRDRSLCYSEGMTRRWKDRKRLWE